MPLHKLESMLTALDHDRPIAVHCKGGYRSAIACQPDSARGLQDVMNVIGRLRCVARVRITQRARLFGPMRKRRSRSLNRAG